MRLQTEGTQSILWNIARIAANTLRGGSAYYRLIHYLSSFVSCNFTIAMLSDRN